MADLVRWKPVSSTGMSSVRGGVRAADIHHDVALFEGLTLTSPRDVSLPEPGDTRNGSARSGGSHLEVGAGGKRRRDGRAAIVHTILIVLVVCLSFPLSGPTPAAAATGSTISGLDAHDGMVTQVGGVYYLYGTRYECGFEWGTDGTPFCGFGVWSSTDKVDWTFQRLLFDPGSTNTYDAESWQVTCGSGGAGCFNPRMVQRGSDGVWILWFNAPADWNRTRANAYYAMGCAGPAGPCGPGAGQFGSLHKPNLSICHDNGDFSIVDFAGAAYIACTMADQTLNIEQLDQWWTNGINVGQRRMAGLTAVESPAIVARGSVLFMTFSDPNCGYCSGTGTSYVRSTTGILGNWGARGQISATSCGGQPRAISFIDGEPYEWIDIWYDQPNETDAPIRQEPVQLDANGDLRALSC
ncbi:hypothetical protein [Geodermatophilus sabuli]|uniref:Glycosyl hydrolases family 43 n=1 Tax=Geodermatophilus sabuli TaxID=1564158 RepID=A0A285E756_9ACTN|nr:hypothetical protein [Geodermatophilus sabuli]MBB3082283.1 hypothetical protein [Geodermatophilus sabuli]SNX94845.1 hypothetical protein SAMN06893097_101645 [Geodermatophilus sabuli]